MDLASKIAEAVGRAVSFIYECIMKLIMEILDRILAPISSGLQAWGENVVQAIDFVFASDYSSGDDSPEVAGGQIVDSVFSGQAMTISIGVTVGIESIIVILSVITAVLTVGASAAIGKIASAIVKVGKAALKNLGKVFLALAGSLISTIMFTLILNEQDDYWKKPMGWGLTAGTVIAAIGNIVATLRIGEGNLIKSIFGDAFGLFLTLLAFFISSFVQSSDAMVIAAVVAGIGMFWTVVSEDVLDQAGTPPWNYLEEIISTAAFGFSLYMALDEVE